MVNQANEVWITGVGVATPLGHTYQEVADHLLAGRSGVRHVKGFDVSDHPSQIAGQVDQVPCPDGWHPHTFAHLHRENQLTLWCARAALHDAGWWGRRSELRLGLVLGVGAEWLTLWEADNALGGARVDHPWQDQESLVQAVRRQLGISGPVSTVSAACASGNYAIAQARRWLELGWCDVCLAGACDTGVTPMSLAGFGNLRALSRRNTEPQAASRPFDKHRDGFVMGEGGAIFVLERADSARKRSGRSYARVAGFGASSDAYNMVIPSPDPEPALAAMKLALADAQVAPTEIGYINAHATSTPVGDAAEARVLEALLGESLGQVPVSSTKSMTGHLLDRRRRCGGAGLPGGDGTRRRAADDQPRRTRPRVQEPLPRPQPSPAAPGQGRGLQLLRLRRQQYLPCAPGCVRRSNSPVFSTPPPVIHPIWKTRGSRISASPFCFQGDGFLAQGFLKGQAGKLHDRGEYQANKLGQRLGRLIKCLATVLGLSKAGNTRKVPMERDPTPRKVIASG